MSCLCVTDDREPFLPWLSWNFGRQTWPHRELIVVTGSAVPQPITDQPGVRVVEVARGMNVPTKRNVALDAAAGSIIAWTDDDDWQHPRRLERLVAALSDGAPIAGWASAWFVDLAQSRCTAYRGRGRVVFNGAGFRTDLARSVRFDPRVPRGSDSAWLRALARGGNAAKILPGDDGFFWLCHDKNISNPARRRRFSESLDVVRGRVGDAWGETDAELDALRERIEQHRPSPVTRITAARSGAEVSASRRARDPAVPSLPSSIPAAAVVKACALDAPFLGVTLPHMLRQARFPFVERLLVLDRRGAFTGKYVSRSRSSEAELDRVVADLLAAGHVDRVVEADPETDHARDVMARYFPTGRVPFHDTTGSPIYATLLGLEAAPVDHVVQFDSDMLFHAAGRSWVEAGLEVLAADPKIWLAMTHAGPPAGPHGTAGSLGRLNARRARWDPNLRLWRFASASTRYFLTDRRRLNGKLSPVRISGGCAPLEVCISAALRRHRATRISLAIEGSWDLHPFSHEQPFPEWVEAIAAAVERGQVPEEQRGHYDIRLDRAEDRRRWAVLVGPSPDVSASKPQPVVEPSPVAARSTTPRRSNAARHAPISVIIPVRDRAGARLRRCLASLAWQSAGRPLQTLVVSQGSRPEVDEELATICTDAGATLIAIGQPSDHWCKPLALNVGLRATDPALAFVMTMDADMILAPDFLAAVLDTLRESPRRIVLCRSSDLPAGPDLPEPDALLDALPELRARTKLRGYQANGGIQAAPRSFFFEVQGYDEDFTWWGSEDNDMVQRAERAGLEKVWICEHTAMLHQWHRAELAAHTDRRRRTEALRARSRNHKLLRDRAHQVVRNTEAWGRPAPPVSRDMPNTGCPRAEDTRIVIGMGTGRCGTASLAALLDAQPGFAVTHEGRPVLRWVEPQDQVLEKLACLTAQPARVVGDVCLSYLPHIRLILDSFPNAVAVCLRREKDATIDSFMRKTPGRNHWSLDPRGDREASFWDLRFPKYRTSDKREALARYWDDYYAEAAEVEKQFPDRFRIFPTECLNARESVQALLDFAGAEEQALLVGVHRNRLLGIRRATARQPTTTNRRRTATAPAHHDGATDRRVRASVRGAPRHAAGERTTNEHGSSRPRSDCNAGTRSARASRPDVAHRASTSRAQAGA